MLKNLENYKENLKNTESKKDTTKKSYNTDMVYENILYTNNTYKVKMTKNTPKYTLTEFESNDEFNDFIENDINNIKHNSWKQMPFSVKFSLCKNYVNNDSTLHEEQKNDLINNLSITNIDNIVEYDKCNTCIKKMYYNLII
jgi:hypothetical protein